MRKKRSFLAILPSAWYSQSESKRNPDSGSGGRRVPLIGGFRMDNKKETAPGVESVEQGFVEEPALSPAEEIEAESFTVSPAELEKDMKNAGFETPEKKEVLPGPSGVEQVETGFQDQPGQDVVSAAFGSGVVSPTELADDLRAAGIEVPEKPAKKPAAEKAPGATGIDQVEAGFQDQPGQDVVSAAFGSGVVSPAELADDLRAVGVEVPEKPAKKPAAEKAPGPNGVEQVETGFRTASPLDVLAAASMSAGTSPKEWANNLRSVGVEVPERPVAEDDGATGIDSVQSGFTAEPEMNTVEELGAIQYAAAPQEVDEKVEQVQSERLGERVQVNDALLSKLKESGYTGDLEDLRKLFADLKDN